MCWWLLHMWQHPSSVNRSLSSLTFWNIRTTLDGSSFYLFLLVFFFWQRDSFVLSTGIMSSSELALSLVSRLQIQWFLHCDIHWIRGHSKTGQEAILILLESWNAKEQFQNLFLYNCYLWKSRCYYLKWSIKI